jgi:Prion-inhibition and propagation
MLCLEIPGFIIGLSGLAAVFHETCAVWKTISSASDYGEDVAKSMNKLEMEYFRF